LFRLEAGQEIFLFFDTLEHMQHKTHSVLILHNIRSAYNVGSIFRTADAVGISKIYLTGYTPTPTDRFGRTRKDIQKTALSSEKTMPWEHVLQINTLIKRLRKEDFYIIGVEQSKQSVDYKTVHPKQKTALIFGNEVRGLSSAVLKKCDIVAEVPMKGEKESLNVAVATGVVLFRVLDV